MTEAIVFNGLNSLDFQEVRNNVTRIPEVICRIREAQEIWDALEQPHFDFLNFIGSDDRSFLSNIRLKSLASAIVQVGLYDRYLRFHKKPEVLIGNYNGDSALKVASGENLFEEMIKESQALKMTRPSAPLQIAEEPVLSGISLTEYAVFKSDEKAYKKLDAEEMDFNKIIRDLIEDQEVKKFVNIGPGNVLIQRGQDDIFLEDVQILESIDMDPMLSWFWSSLKDVQIASGN